jgi:hypothetical protein
MLAAASIAFAATIIRRSKGVNVGKELMWKELALQRLVRG